MIEGLRWRVLLGDNAPVSLTVLACQNLWRCFFPYRLVGMFRPLTQPPLQLQRIADVIPAPARVLQEPCELRDAEKVMGGLDLGIHAFSRLSQEKPLKTTLHMERSLALRLEGDREGIRQKT